MKWFLASTALLLLTIAPIGCRSNENSISANSAGYKGIYIGQRETELPKWLNNRIILYEGVYEGEGFTVLILDRRVMNIRITYSGKLIDGTVINKPVTLADALKDHSLTRTATPVLAIGEGKNDVIYGLDDLTNNIIFHTPQPTDPESQVSLIIYGEENAATLSTKSKNKLLDEQSSLLITAAKSARGVKIKSEQ